MKLKHLRPVLLLLAAAGLFSCSGAAPKIIYGFIELVYYPGREKPEERLSFFVLPEDDEGVENLSELYLYHDKEGLRWLFNSDDWISHEEEGKAWIGSRNIAMYDRNLPLPRGQYRAVLVNRGGESVERRFTFDSPETPPYEFPVLTVGDGTYHIESRYPVNHIVAYDQEGTTVQTVNVGRLDGDIRDLGLLGMVRTIALWAEDPGYHISALTDAASVR